MSDHTHKTNEFLMRTTALEPLRLSYAYGYRIPHSTHEKLTLDDIRKIATELTAVSNFMETNELKDSDDLLAVLRDMYIYGEINKTTIEWHDKYYWSENFKDLSLNQTGVYLLEVPHREELKYKVGCTQSLRDRIKQHHKANHHNPIYLYAFIPTPNYKELEAAILYKIIGHTRFEWFDQNDQLIEFARYLYSVRGNNE